MSPARPAWGKSTLQYDLAMLNIFAERGVAVIDPHGDLAEAIADSIPRRRDQPVGCARGRPPARPGPSSDIPCCSWPVVTNMAEYATVSGIAA